MTGAEPKEAVAVNLAYYRLPHIDLASGYVQLGRYLADKVETVRVLEPLPLRALPRPLTERLGRSRGLAYYEPAGLRLELAVLRRLLAAPGEVCHVLYAEDHFNHLARVRHLPRSRRGTLVATFHQPPETFERIVRFGDLETRLGALDAAIVMSRDQAAMLRGLMAPERVHLVPHGVNAFHFKPPDTRPPGPVRCLAVGSWLRDLATLRAAIERVAAADPSISFEVVTSPEHARELAGAPATEVRSGISGEALLAAYQSAHVFVHPLLDAAANNALAEAMACGLPVVATDVGGVPEHVDDACGVRTPRADAGAMAAAILALAHDGERRVRMGAAAREAALQNDWPHVAWQTLQVYGAAAAG